MSQLHNIVVRLIIYLRFVATSLGRPNLLTSRVIKLSEKNVQSFHFGVMCLNTENTLVLTTVRFSLVLKGTEV